MSSPRPEQDATRNAGCQTGKPSSALLSAARRLGRSQAPLTAPFRPCDIGWTSGRSFGHGRARALTPTGRRESLSGYVIGTGSRPSALRGGATTAAYCVVKNASVIWRRRVKLTLIDEAGGQCQLCGYNKCAAALQFHHIDPAAKSFALSDDGVARSLDRARSEAAKCLLLCANCHAEVEVGVTHISDSSRA